MHTFAQKNLERHRISREHTGGDCRRFGWLKSTRVTRMRAYMRVRKSCLRHSARLWGHSKHLWKLTQANLRAYTPTCTCPTVCLPIVDSCMFECMQPLQKFKHEDLSLRVTCYVCALRSHCEYSTLCVPGGRFAKIYTEKAELLY